MMSEQDKNLQAGNLYSSRTLFFSVLFSFGFLVFEFLALPKSQPSLMTFVRHFNNGAYLRLLFVLFLSIAAFGIFLGFVYVALASPLKFRIIYFLIFSIVILTEYGYYKAFNSFFRYQEMEVALYATNWTIITNSIVSYFNYLALIPIVFFGFLLLRMREIFKSGLVSLLVILSLFCSFFFATTYFTTNSFYVHSFNYGLRTVIGFPVIWYVGTINDTPKNYYYYVPREKVEFRSSTKPNINIVFIVDESIRPDHLSLNGYELPTSPTLDRLHERGYIKNWGTAVSGTTCSVSSNALMLTGVQNLPDKDFEVFKLPTIFQYSKAMNYKNHYFDGQTWVLWNGKSSDVVDFGNWVTSVELKKGVEQSYDIDSEIAKRIKEIVSTSTGNFIWVNKYGVHQSYMNSYPDSGDKLLKDTNSEKHDVSELVRKYDGAIRYNSESFFSELSNNDTFGKNTFYIYTSDHGRTLGEKEAIASHCSNTKPEASVPLFLMSSPENLPEVDTNFKASHANIFAALLDLMKFPENERKYKYAISLLKAKSSDSKQRFYLSGDLNGVDAYEIHPYD